jgi:hypothetical protein
MPGAICQASSRHRGFSSAEERIAQVKDFVVCGGEKS